MSDFFQRKIADFHQAQKQKAQEKQALWQRIQTDAPDMAQALKQLSQVFGKVKLNSVEFFGDRDGKS